MHNINSSRISIFLRDKKMLHAATTAMAAAVANALGTENVSHDEPSVQIENAPPTEPAPPVEPEVVDPLFAQADTKKTNAKRCKRSEKAGLVFPISRVSKIMRKQTAAKRITADSQIFVTGAAEYIAAEVIEAAISEAINASNGKKNKVKTIKPRHILLAIRNDKELDSFFRNIHVADGGVVPYINPVLLKKKDGKKKAKKADAAAAAPEETAAAEEEEEEEEEEVEAPKPAKTKASKKTKKTVKDEPSVAEKPKKKAKKEK